MSINVEGPVQLLFKSTIFQQINTMSDCFFYSIKQLKWAFASTLDESFVKYFTINQVLLSDLCHLKVSKHLVLTKTNLQIVFNNAAGQEEWSQTPELFQLMLKPERVTANEWNH